MTSAYSAESVRYKIVERVVQDALKQCWTRAHGNSAGFTGSSGSSSSSSSTEAQTGRRTDGQTDRQAERVRSVVSGRSVQPAEHSERAARSVERVYIVQALAQLTRLIEWLIAACCCRPLSSFSRRPILNASITKSATLLCETLASRRIACRLTDDWYWSGRKTRLRFS